MNENTSKSLITIRIPSNEWQALLNLFNDTNSLLKYVISLHCYYNSTIITTDKQKIKNIINFLDNLLIMIGFDDEYNLNNEGKIIEQIIDKFIINLKSEPALI